MEARLYKRYKKVKPAGRGMKFGKRESSFDAAIENHKAATISYGRRSWNPPLFPVFRPTANRLYGTDFTAIMGALG